MSESRQASTEAAPQHDEQCEIATGAVGFDGLVCLCAHRATEAAPPAEDFGGTAGAVPDVEKAAPERDVSR